MMTVLRRENQKKLRMNAVKNIDLTISKDIERVVQANLFKRSILTIIMIPSFIYICSLNDAFIACFVIFLATSIIKEVISITKYNNYYVLHTFIIFSFASSIFIYCIIDSLVIVFPFLAYISIIRHYVFFYLYLGLFISFVCSLEKGKLKRQLSVFSLIHLCSYFVGISVKSAIINVTQGKFWFVFPSLLVICNDIFAYIVGKAVGKTPLFALSPKKTVEGLFGAFFFTSLFGWLMCYQHLNYPIFSDIYIEELRKLFILELWGYRIRIPSLYIHCIPFVLVASFIAPFSGFLASALKRAYNKKDFGHSIPGHGGLTDRFDCQCIAVLFTTVYLKSCIKTKEQKLLSVYLHITKSLETKEIGVLTEMLKKYLNDCTTFE